MEARSRLQLPILLTLAAVTGWAANPTAEETAKLRAEVEPVLNEFFREFSLSDWTKDHAARMARLMTDSGVSGFFGVADVSKLSPADLAGLHSRWWKTKSGAALNDLKGLEVLSSEKSAGGGEITQVRFHCWYWSSRPAERGNAQVQMGRVLRFDLVRAGAEQPWKISSVHIESEAPRSFPERLWALAVAVALIHAATGFVFWLLKHPEFLGAVVGLSLRGQGRTFLRNLALATAAIAGAGLCALWPPAIGVILALFLLSLLSEKMRRLGGQGRTCLQNLVLVAAAIAGAGLCVVWKPAIGVILVFLVLSLLSETMRERGHAANVNWALNTLCVATAAFGFLVSGWIVLMCLVSESLAGLCLRQGFRWWVSFAVALFFVPGALAGYSYCGTFKAAAAAGYITALALYLIVMRFRSRSLRRWLSHRPVPGTAALGLG